MSLSLNSWETFFFCFFVFRCAGCVFQIVARDRKRLARFPIVSLFVCHSAPGFVVEMQPCLLRSRPHPFESPNEERRFWFLPGNPRMGRYFSRIARSVSRTPTKSNFPSFDRASGASSSTVRPTQCSSPARADTVRKNPVRRVRSAIRAPGNCLIAGAIQ